jgi:hypothetical protein
MQLNDATIGGVPVLDRLKIIDEVSRYAWAWDSGEVEQYLDRYMPDGILEHPTPDGNPGQHKGREAIREAIAANMAARPKNAYGLQHHFSALQLEPSGTDIRAKAYCAVMRHEFHRTYWPHGPSFRMGTWHALYGRTGDEWRIKLLTVRMWTDTAFNSGIAIQDRRPGMVGTGLPFG